MTTAPLVLLVLAACVAPTAPPATAVSCWAPGARDTLAVICAVDP